MCRISAGALKERKPVAAADRPAGGVPTPLRHMVAAAGRLKIALGLLPQIGNRKLKTHGYGPSSSRSHYCIVDARCVTPQNRPTAQASLEH